jgi:uncharacterized membrane protein YqjE
VSEQAGPRSAGLLASLRGLLMSGLALAETRLALRSNELEEPKLRLVQGLVMAVAGLFVLGVGLVLFAGFVLLLFWDGYRLPALAALTLGFLGAGAWLLASARRRLRSDGGPFGATLAELRADRAAVAGRDDRDRSRR